MYFFFFFFKKNHYLLIFFFFFSYQFFFSLGNYISSDLLHRNTINPVLYKPFDNIFKNQFDQIYNLYIKEDGIAAINIKSSTLKTIEEQMETDNYNYLMFCEVNKKNFFNNNIYIEIFF